MARWRPAATASGRCVCGVAWIEFNASRPVSGCKSTRDAAEVMWDLAAYRRPPEIKAHPRWARQACRRHQRDRSRPWCAPNPGEIDEELNGGDSGHDSDSNGEHDYPEDEDDDSLDDGDDGYEGVRMRGPPGNHDWFC